MFDVVALGEMLIDFAPVETDPAGYPTLKAQPGGAPCNFLAALQKYGCSTAIIGKVGADSFGNLLVQTAADCGIETRGVRKDASSFTTLAFVTLDATGNREFSFARKPGADTQLTAEEVDYDLIENCRAFHFGTLSLTDKPVRRRPAGMRLSSLPYRSEFSPPHTECRTDASFHRHSRLC